MSNRFHRLELEESRQQTTQPAFEHVSIAQKTTQVQADLHDSGYWMRLANQNRRAGEFEDALRHYSRAVELDRATVQGWVGQVQMLIALGEYPEAELWVRKALELFRNHAELLAARAQALCRSGDLKQAQAVCDAAISQPGQSAYPWLARGDLMLAREDAVEQHCFDKAAQADPDWLILIEIAAVYLFYRRHAKALTRCRQAIEKASDQAYCWYLQGVCERQMGLNEPARRSFKQCLDLVPKHAAARENLREMEASPGSFRSVFGRLFGRG